MNLPLLARVRKLLAAPVFEQDQDKTRTAALLNAVLWVVAGATVFGTVAVIAVEPAEWLFSLLFAVILLAVLLYLQFLLHRGRVRLVGWLLSSTLWLGITVLLLGGLGGIHNVSVTGYFLIVAVASLVLGEQVALVFGLLSIAAVAALFVAEIAGAISVPTPSAGDPTPLIVLCITLILTTLLLRWAVGSIRRALVLAQSNEDALRLSQVSLTEQAEDLEIRGMQLEAAAMVARDAAAIRDINRLLDSAAQFIAERFQFYHTSIFLLEENGTYAVMAAAVGQERKEVLAPELRLEVGEGGIVGQVAQTGQPYISPDVREDPRYLPNPHLPETCSELALPLRVGGQVIGVLNLESTEVAAFSEQDVFVFQILADQLSLAIENTRLLLRIRLAVDELNATAADILATSRQQAGGASEQAGVIAHASSTIDEVRVIAEQNTSQAQSVADLAQQTFDVSRVGQQTVSDTVASMGELKEQVRLIAQDIRSLSTQAQTIGAIITAVEEIAAQSNMLALNAAVEAARAGAAGSGFAVVAQEVRSLAEQSQEATIQVKEILTQVQRAIGQAVLVTEQGLQEADRGGSLVKEAGAAIRRLGEGVTVSTESARQIVTAAGQQLTGVEQIGQAMGRIHEVTAQNVASAQRMEQLADSLNLLAQQFQELLRQD